MAKYHPSSNTLTSTEQWGRGAINTYISKTCTSHYSPTKTKSILPSLHLVNPLPDASPSMQGRGGGGGGGEGVSGGGV